LFEGTRFLRRIKHELYAAAVLVVAVVVFSGVSPAVQSTSVRAVSNTLAPGHDASNAPVFAIDIDQMEDKPWRRPGVAVSDYFNYGFTEETWRVYCQRQAQLRLENQMRGKIAVYRPANNVPPPATVQRLGPYDVDASSQYAYDSVESARGSGVVGGSGGARAYDERADVRDQHTASHDYRYDTEREAKRSRH